jgi:hypothetical protein
MFLATNSRSQFSQPLYVLGITKWVHSAHAAVISWTVQVLSCSTLLVLQWKRRRKSNLTPKAVLGVHGGSKTVSRELLQSLKTDQIILCLFFKYLPRGSPPYWCRMKSFASVIYSDLNRLRCSLHSVAESHLHQALACGDPSADSDCLNQLHAHGHVVPR